MRKSLTILLMIFATVFTVNAQDSKAALEYMNVFTDEFNKIQQLQIDYTSYLVHGRGNVIEQKRKELEEAVQAAVKKVEGVETYPNDNGLKKAALSTFKGIEEMATTDYSAEVEKKAGCTDCFAAMEWDYKLADEAAKEVNKALDKMNKRIDKFAEDNDIDIVYEESEFGRTVARIGRINDYLQQLSLCVHQAQYAGDNVVKLLNEQKIKEADAQVRKMKKEVKEAQARYKSIESIPEDYKCKQKAKVLLDWYEELATKLYPEMLDGFDKNGNITQKGAKVFNKNIQKINSMYPPKQGAYDQSIKELLEKAVPKPERSFKG